jgi:hypothetical protein
MKRFRFLPLTVLSTFLIFGLAGCEDQSAKAVYNAQNCIDTATSSTVSQCTDMVAGINTPQANLILCSADYVAQSFTNTRFVNAFQYINNPTNPSGISPIVIIFAYLVFNDTVTAHTSDITLAHCTSSNVQSMLRLAYLSKMATLLNTGSAFTPSSSGITPTNMKTAIQGYTGNGNSDATLGNLVTNSYPLFCYSGSPFESNSICDNLKAAINTAGGTPTAIGFAFRAAIAP